ncbi:DUF4174 domain-containing protein [Zobellia nedashkovskayae]|uniref:DUF4174 domain-containing protein n=1 Tax=Zobellia nedashkovskayae TaxID=2779510 RepID=UPI00188C8518|nr:DUF4174 domain-containing protein [Zobellia nedashkovskayae]
MAYTQTFGQDLDSYKWKNRLLLFVAQDIDGDALSTNLTTFTKEQKKLTDRDLVLFVMNPKKVNNQDGSKSNLDAEMVYKQLKLTPDFEGVLLIGKDGGIKLTQAFPLTPEVVFDKIDGMPMRQSEMRSRED